MANAERIIDLLHEAKARPAGAERARFLDEACRDDAALKEQIISLLEADADEGESDFLKHTLFVPPAAPVTEKPGDRIGRYKLLEQIGEGGCGVVYMAEQEEPVWRRVALKVIKLGMDTKQVIARFEAERQTLALMDHPNIAKVLDAGATETGRPFFVMELVRGIKITDYCDQNKLSTNERLELFIQVCQAIQHAHQKGIIHRDIKPSNILVTQHDDLAVPKVIDFGIAKATVGQLTDKTVFTAFAQFIGTPAYMSPEQAQMSGLDIDTRADIYSLGVLLYELLTGHTPFDAKELLAAGMDEMRRKIREDEPARPSTSLSTMTVMDLTTVAKRRHVEPPRLIHLIRGDLDWLVMKCLEKDRTRRYETANALVMDLERHLNNEPVVACPPSNLYRFQKMVRRNKLAFVAASAVVAALVIGLGISTWMFFKEKQARQRAVVAEQEQSRLRLQAEANEKRAVSEAAESRRVAALLGDLSSNLRELPNPARAEAAYRESLAMWMRLLGKEHREVEDALSSLAQMLQQGKLARADQTAREAAQKCHSALAYFEKLVSDQNNHQKCWFIAVAYQSLAQLFKESGQAQEAEQVYQDTQVLWRKMVADSNVEDYRWQLANNYDELGWLLRQTDHLDEASESYRQALALWKKLVAGSDRTDYRDRWLWTLGNFVETPKTERQRDAVESFCRAELSGQRKLLGDNHVNVADTINALARLLQIRGKHVEAETLYREALATRRKLFGNEHRDVDASLFSLVRVLQQQGKLAEAAVTAHEVAQKHETAFEQHLKRASDQNSRRECWSFAISYETLGQLFQELGQTQEAEKAYRDTQVLWRKLVADFNAEDYGWHLAINYEQLGNLLRQAGRATESLEAYRGAQTIWLKLVAEFNMEDRRAHLGRTDELIGQLLKEAGQLDEATEVYRQALAVWKKLVAEFNRDDYHNHLSGTLVNLAGTLQTAGKRTEAELFLREAESAIRENLALRKQRFGEVHREVDAALVSLARVLQQTGKLADAEAVWREELAMERKLSGNEHLFVANSLRDLATVLEAQGKLVEAETTYRELLALRRKLLPAEDPQLATALAGLTTTLLAVHKFTEVEPLARECLAIRERKLPDDWLTFNARSMVGGSLLGQKKYAEAEPLLISGYEGLKQRENKISALGKSRVKESLQRLVQLYEATGQSEKAAEWSRKLAEFDKAGAEKKAAAPKL